MQFLKTAKSVAQAVGKAVWPERTPEPSAEKEKIRRRFLLREEERVGRINRARLRAKRGSASSAEEAARAKRFVGIAFRGPSDDRRAWVPWAGLDVWEIVEDLKKNGYDLLVEEGDIPKRALDLALAYYRAYPEGVDQAIERNRRSPEEWQRLFPHVDVAPRRG